jgi:hypothetical protein
VRIVMSFLNAYSEAITDLVAIIMGMVIIKNGHPPPTTIQECPVGSFVLTAELKALPKHGSVNSAEAA